RCAAEQFALPHFSILLTALRRREDRIDASVHARAIFLQRIECARGGEALQYALVDRARVHAAREVGDVAERLVAARIDDRLDRLGTYALKRGEGIVDRACVD